MYVYIILLKNVSSFLYIHLINILIFRAKFNIDYQLSKFPILKISISLYENMKY